MEAQGCTPVTLDAVQTLAVRLMGSPAEPAAGGIGARARNSQDSEAASAKPEGRLGRVTRS